MGFKQIQKNRDRFVTKRLIPFDFIKSHDLQHQEFNWRKYAL